MVSLPVPEPPVDSQVLSSKKQNIHFLPLGWISWNVSLLSHPLLLELPCAMLCSSHLRHFDD